MVFVGDFLFSSIAVPHEGRDHRFSRANRSLGDVLDCWLDPPNAVWHRFSEEWLSGALGAIYTICFESIEQDMAERLH